MVPFFLPFGKAIVGRVLFLLCLLTACKQDCYGAVTVASVAPVSL